MKCPACSHRPFVRKARPGADSKSNVFPTFTMMMASRRRTEGGILAALSDTPPKTPSSSNEERDDDDDDNDSNTSMVTTPQSQMLKLKHDDGDGLSPLSSASSDDDEEEESSEDEESSSDDEESDADGDEDSETEASFQGDDESLKEEVGDEFDDLLSEENSEEDDDDEDAEDESDYNPEDAEDEDSDLEADDCDEDEIRPARKNKARTPEKHQQQSKTKQTSDADTPLEDDDDDKSHVGNDDGSACSKEIEAAKDDDDSKLDVEDCEEDETARKNNSSDENAFANENQMSDESPCKGLNDDDANNPEPQEAGCWKTKVGFEHDVDKERDNGSNGKEQQLDDGVDDMSCSGSIGAEFDIGADVFDQDSDSFVENNETMTVDSSSRNDDSRVYKHDDESFSIHDVDVVAEIVNSDEEDDDDDGDEVVAEIVEDDDDEDGSSFKELSDDNNNNNNCSNSLCAGVDDLPIGDSKQTEFARGNISDEIIIDPSTNPLDAVAQPASSDSTKEFSSPTASSTAPIVVSAPELSISSSTESAPEQTLTLRREECNDSTAGSHAKSVADTSYEAEYDSTAVASVSLESERFDNSRVSDTELAIQEGAISVSDSSGVFVAGVEDSLYNEQQNSKNANANVDLPIQDENKPDTVSQDVLSEICEPMNKLSSDQSGLAVNEDITDRGSIVDNSCGAPEETKGVQVEDRSASDSAMELKQDVIVDKENDGHSAVKLPADQGGDTKKQTRRPLRREGSVKRGKWKLGSKIGSGSFGVVHIGMNTETGTLMAVKSVKMEAAAMKDAKREIQLMKSLKHTNIVQYYGAEMDTKYLHIFQEWVPAGSVTTMLCKFGPFPLEVLRNYLAQTLEGLAYLHENNIMHRDIKGSNILVNDEGVVKLADFGASKRLAHLQNDMMHSLTMRGTPYFMAPEVFEEKYSSKADVWSVGCVAYQMATGTPPWKDLGLSNPVSLFNHISKSIGPPVIDVAETEALFQHFKKVVALCFERIPENRPSAKELLDDLLFSAENLTADDDQSEDRGLFSPLSICSRESLSSPILGNLSPIRHQARRRNSIGMSPFLSPPLPRSARKRHSPSLFSPRPDSTEWPTWAREQMKSSSMYANEASLGNDSLRNKVIESGNMLDSLAFSTDSQASQQVREPDNHLSPPDSIEIGQSIGESPLLGLQLIGTASTGKSDDNRSGKQSGTTPT